MHRHREVPQRAEYEGYIGCLTGRSEEAIDAGQSVNALVSDHTYTSWNTIAHSSWSLLVPEINPGDWYTPRRTSATPQDTINSSSLTWS